MCRLITGLKKDDRIILTYDRACLAVGYFFLEMTLRSGVAPVFAEDFYKAITEKKSELYPSFNFDKGEPKWEAFMKEIFGKAIKDPLYKTQTFADNVKNINSYAAICGIMQEGLNNAFRICNSGGAEGEPEPMAYMKSIFDKHNKKLNEIKDKQKKNPDDLILFDIDHFELFANLLHCRIDIYQLGEKDPKSYGRNTMFKKILPFLIIVGKDHTKIALLYKHKYLQEFENAIVDGVPEKKKPVIDEARENSMGFLNLCINSSIDTMHNIVGEEASAEKIKLVIKELETKLEEEAKKHSKEATDLLDAIKKMAEKGLIDPLPPPPPPPPLPLLPPPKCVMENCENPGKVLCAKNKCWFCVSHLVE